MRDPDVRSIVLSALLNEHSHDPTTRIVEEMGIWNGSARIDIAVINGEMHGFELKSERDTLSRLDGQAELYEQVFDRITLVAAEKHIHKAKPLISAFWGLTSVTVHHDGHLSLTEVRPAIENPYRDKKQIARLLWKSEQLLILEKIGIAKGMRSKSADFLQDALAQSLSERALSAHVREALKARQGWLGQSRGDQRQVPAGAD
ncbi:sce7726 family protein [Bradyrhizobium sp. JYMT SZCCT0428]|uniref:sce7726 family protein n=1 Tax=Bradyrhizobium sp. JYMT SZCCT0428 TaxID=2807673 RepID=UPI001BA8538E|nr:sce7726 family protein [Bradyrhizobium sp. JYMT SZCCT0428]MBR1156265.1 sce7726 family protein [Bradyrhizobium sp. JYMT SZCCT0428]